VRGWFWKSWGPPALVVALASLLVAVPLVVAATFRSEPELARAELAVSRAAALPACSIVGSAASETLVGTAGDDVICALGGDDVVRGRGGDDVLFGSTGDDSVEGGSGDDRLYGHFGVDRLRGGPGRDFLQGGGGPDRLSGGPGSDLADYGQRISSVRVSIGRGANDGWSGEGDYVGRDVERVRGGHAGDTLIGNALANRLRGGGGDDALKGKRGNDRLGGGAGRDRLDGRDGDSFVDALRCGPGEPDTALADARDTVAADCETVQQPKKPPEGRNRPPTDILLADSSVPEDQPVGTVVGTLGASDEDAGDSHTFALVNGAGDDDNGAFAIVGDQLRTAAVFDFELKSSFTVRVRARDERGAVFQEALAITVTDVVENRAPTDVSLSPSLVDENEPVGTTVGALAATDADSGDSHTFALVSGAGDADNASFSISGAQLRTAAVFDFEAKSSYAIRVATTDAAGATFAKALTVTVADVNEAPTGLALSDDTLPENEPVGSTVGQLSVSDVDAGQSHAFTLVAGAGDTDNGRFAIDGSTLKTAAVLDFEAQPSYSIRVRATDDGTPARSVEREFTITVTDTLEPPTPDPKSATTDEDTPVTITLSATDPEGDDVTSFTTTTSAASHGTVGPVGAIACAGAPKVCSADVLFTPDVNYNGSAGFSYTASDGANTSPPAAVSITVNPVNDAPAASPGSRTTDEDTPLTLDLADLASDVETADANLTYEIVTPPAHGTATATTYTPDADFNGSDSFTYRVTDRGDPDNCGAVGPACDGPLTSSTETVSITVDPGNDSPQASPLSDSVAEDGSLPIDLAALVADVETADGDLVFEIVTQPTHGDLTGSGGARTYTPDADFNGADSFTYRVTDRGDPDNCGAPGPACDGPLTSSTETVSITVNAVNDAPVIVLPAGPVLAVQDTDTPIAGISLTDVDAGGDAVEVTLSVLHGTLTVDTAVLGGVGAMQVVGSGTAGVVITASLAQINTTLAATNGLVYHSNAAFTGADALTVNVSDLGHNGSGGPQTDSDSLAIDVVPPNVAPVAASQSVSTNEDTPKTITLSASDADGDDPLSFAIASTPSHGTLGAIGSVTCSHATPNVCTADVLYTPAADYNGPDSFTFTANDGIVDSAPATVSITVDPVNDAPRLQNTEALALAYTENDAATPITGTTTITDDSPNFDTGTLTVDYSAGGQAEDRLEIRNQGTGAGQIGVSGANVTFGGTTIGTFTGGTGTTALVVTLNANATPAAAQALVRNVTYRNVSENPSTATRTARFVLTDGDGGTSAPATREIPVTAVNDAPVVTTTAGSLTHVEGDGPEAIDTALTVTDVDSPNIASATVQITGNYANGQDVLAAVAPLFGVTPNFNPATGTLTLTGATTIANYQTIMRAVTYENTSQAPSTLDRTVTFKVNDGALESAGATRGIVVTGVDDAPTVTASAGNTPYTEQAPAVAVDPALVAADVDGGANPTGATVTIVSPIAGDTLSFTTQNGITGIFASGVLTLSGTATLAQYEAALRSVGFSNATNDAPGTSRSVEFKLTTPVASNTTTKAIAITQVNDAPSTDPTDAADSALEQVATAVDAGIVVSDPDSASLTGATVQITGNFQSGQDTLQFTTQNGITGNFTAGTLTLTGTATVAQYQTALRSVTYTNTSDTPSTLTRTLTFRVTDNGTPGLQSAPQTRDLNVVPVNDAPTDAGESQTATGNTRLEVELTVGGSTNPRRTSATGNLLDNAADVDDAPAALSVDLATVSDPPNGTVSVNVDGSYVYTPDVGFTGADSFTYRVKDDENAQSAVSTVSITVANRVWYVRADAAAGGDGRSETPFNTLTAADTAASATGDTIYVFRKTGDAGTVSDSSFDLLTNQRLLGSAVDLTDGAATLYSGGAGLQPSLTTTSIKLDDGNTVRGLAVSGSGSGAEAIEAGAGDVSGTLDLLNIAGSSGGIELANGASGTWNLSDVTVNTTGGDAIVAASAGTVNFTAAGTISVTAAAGLGLNISLTTTSGVIDSTTVTSSPNNGIRLDDNPGSLTLNDVNLTTTGIGLDVDSSNDVTVSGGDADITSAATAVNLTTITSNPANPPDVTLDQVNSTGGTTGINIDDIGVGTFSAAGGTLSGHTAAEIDINAGSGDISYPGTIGNGTGLSAQITGRTAGTVTLSGNINDTNDAGGGIDMSANTGGTVTFSGATKTLNTGAGAGFASTGSNPTINFTSGGLDIDTTSGTGFGATGGGTVTVQGTGNTINSGIGIALNIGSTTIGAAGLNFQSISANGAPNGIALNGTGTVGSLTVSGNGNTSQGGDNSGGEIQNTSGAGVSLINTRNASLTNMNIHNTVGDGIGGTLVNGFTFARGKIDRSGLNAALSPVGAPNTSNIGFNDIASGIKNLEGAVSITGSNLTNAFYNGLDSYNESGTISDLTFTNNILTGTGVTTSSQGSGVHLDANGSASTGAAVTRATVSGNNINNFASGAGIQMQGGNGALGPQVTMGTPGSATSIISITNNTIGSSSVTGGIGTNGIAAGVTGTGQGKFSITNNGTAAVPIQHFKGIGVAAFGGNLANVVLIVDNNVIDASDNIANSSGISVGSQLGVGQAGTLEVSIQGNTVSGMEGNGILTGITNSDNSGNFSVKNNTVGAPQAGARPGIRVESGSANGDTSVCLDISGNTTTGSALSPSGIGLRKQGTSTTVNSFQIVGMAATSTPGVEQYVGNGPGGKNPGTTNGNAGDGSVNGVLLISATSGFGNCSAFVVD
jgi:hypothetical protein